MDWTIPDGPPPIEDKPYRRIYEVIANRCRIAESPAPELKEISPDRPEVVRFLRRMGAFPKSWTGRRAARAAAAAVGRMSSGAGETTADICAALLAFCLEDGAAAFCRQSPRCAECPVQEHCDYPDRRRTIKDMPRTERPRERLLREGEEHLSDIELLALIIGGGSQEATALDLAAELMSDYGSYRRLAQCSAGELTRVAGIGPAKAARIKAAMGIARRYAGEKLERGTRITGSQQLFDYMREKLGDRQKEYFCTLMLDTKHRVLREYIVAVGSLNESIVHPREVFKRAITESAHAVIFVHNHPSGNPDPSPQDRRLTSRLTHAGDLVGIQVLDHLIIGSEGYYSFAEHGLLNG